MGVVRSRFKAIRHDYVLNGGLLSASALPWQMRRDLRSVYCSHGLECTLLWSPIAELINL